LFGAVPNKTQEEIGIEATEANESLDVRLAGNGRQAGCEPWSPAHGACMVIVQMTCMG